MGNVDTRDVSTLVREARQKKGLSLRELGDRIRKADGTALSPQYLNDIEHGRRNLPDEPLLSQLAEVLGLDPNVLRSLAGREPKEVTSYLSAMPEQTEEVGRLFRKAREVGFRDWKTFEAELDKLGRRRPK